MPIPRTDNELMVWLNNFSASFATQATALGFNEADVNSVRADAAILSYLIGDVVPTYKSALQARTAYKTLIMSGPLGVAGGEMPPAPVVAAPPAAVVPGVVPRLRQLVQRIQLAPGYTEAIGLALGIVEAETSGPRRSAQSADARPTAKAIALAGQQVKIEFTKGGFSGVQVEGRRAGEQAWQSLGTDNYSPFVDTRPPAEAGKPEVREYRLRYIQRDEPVGDWSDIISATTKP
ncbi:MAG TPA: hypothetical protein VGP08_12230 [Pyrinomonadaceae bacterium]|jgi:hypothetical protein|nr:hypothetical protein [Pyrinomonadaceae bacterium]